MTFRTRVAVEGVLGVWTTNLPDEDVREFCRANDRGSEADDIPINLISRTYKFRFFDRLFPFRDGACRWTVFDDHNWLLFRTAYEWEIWNARQLEIKELRDEQEDERVAGAQMFRTESDHLQRTARLAVLAEDWASAERHLLARAEIAREIRERKLDNWWSYGILGNVSWWFASFPSTSQGIGFLRQYLCLPHNFVAFAGSCAVRGRLPNPVREAEIDRVFDAAIALFPNDARLYKHACLFWRRHHRLDLAVSVCKLAIRRGVADDTQTGFGGRLKRLEREQERSRLS